MRRGGEGEGGREEMVERKGRGATVERRKRGTSRAGYRGADRDTESAKLMFRSTRCLS